MVSSSHRARWQRRKSIHRRSLRRRESAAPWPLSACLAALPADFAGAVAQAADLGFTHVDADAAVERPAAHREALADSGVLVFRMPCPSPARRDVSAPVFPSAASVSRIRGSAPAQASNFPSGENATLITEGWAPPT